MVDESINCLKKSMLKFNSSVSGYSSEIREKVIFDLMFF
jgi:hypothetical protein